MNESQTSESPLTESQETASKIPESIRSAIQTSYSALLEQQGFKARWGQKQMIAAISRSLCGFLDNAETDTRISVTEAGTGVGKSIGYLIPAINIAQAQDKKLVVSTATAALQDQLVNQDLPSIKKILETPFSFGLVKGRRRYLCQLNLDKNLHGAQGGSTAMLDYFDGGQALSQDSLKIFAELNSARTSDQWDGDRDHWPQEIADFDWNLITSDRHSCMGGRCQFFSNCSFYESREAADELDILVVNHDLLLADLMLGGGVILPAPEDCIYVLDEAHHLAEKTRNHLSARLSTGATLSSLAEVIETLSKISDSFQSTSESAELGTILLSLRSQSEELLSCISGLEESAAEQTENKPDKLVRFEGGELPQAILAASKPALSVSKNLCLSLEQLVSKLEKISESDSSEVRNLSQNWFPLAGEWLAKSESWRELLGRYANPDKKADKERGSQYFARWIRSHSRGSGFDLFAAPLEVSDQLKDLLWDRAASAVLTSATLSVKGDFERLLTQLGLPADTPCESIQSPFDYANNAVLELCKSAPDPRNDSEYADFLCDLLQDSVDHTQGTLVLFSSKKQLEQVYELIQIEWKSRILVQGLIPRMEIVAQHKGLIDKGQGSIIFGLRSFAEGIDLPGKYCTHLVITRIPFSVPDDPIEATISERISAEGGNSFRQLALPNAAIRLIQSVGRLIRSETDRGTVTITDPRLLTGSYSRYLLSALPPFKLVERD